MTTPSTTATEGWTEGLCGDWSCHETWHLLPPVGAPVTVTRTISVCHPDTESVSLIKAGSQGFVISGLVQTHQVYVRLFDGRPCWVDPLHLANADIRMMPAAAEDDESIDDDLYDEWETKHCVTCRARIADDRLCEATTSWTVYPSCRNCCDCHQQERVAESVRASGWRLVETLSYGLEDSFVSDDEMEDEANQAVYEYQQFRSLSHD